MRKMREVTNGERPVHSQVAYNGEKVVHPRSHWFCIGGSNPSLTTLNLFSNKFSYIKDFVYIYIIIKNKQIMKVFTKARKYSQPVETKYTVDIVRNKSIVIYVNDLEVNRFVLGDTAEYGSYNLRYTGPITKITDKVIQITAYPNSRNERTYNLDLSTFCWRNETFNAVECAEHNLNEMHYI